jgi:DNA replication and repair protein RecF
LELIRKGEGWARIEANFDLEGRREKRVLKLSLGERGVLKVLEIDGTRKMAGRNLLPIVIFEPEQMRMITDSPEMRRAYLDERISFLDYEYAKNLVDYRKVVAQRNRLLKQIKSGNAKVADLFVWHVKMSELAAPIILARRDYIAKLNKKLEGDYRKVSKNRDELEVVYRPNFEVEDGLSLSSKMFKKLEADVELDLQTGFSRTGPHRDDWMVKLNGQNAAVGASRGEIRTLILSLKLYEFEHLQESFGITPLVLLDDVMSELDGSRRKELLKFFEGAQVVVSGVE